MPSRDQQWSLEGAVRKGTATLDVLAVTQARFKGHESTDNENKKSSCLLRSLADPVFAGVDRADFGAARVGQRQGLQAVCELCCDEFERAELA